MLVMVNIAPPVLDSVTVCAALIAPTGWLPKLKLEGDTLATGTVPVPVKPALCGLPLALSVTVSVPVRVPEAVGVKVTLIAQCVPGARAPPQLFVWPKSPFTAMLVTLSDAPPVLVSVTACAPLAVPTG